MGTLLPFFVVGIFPGSAHFFKAISVSFLILFHEILLQLIYVEFEFNNKNFIDILTDIPDEKQILLTNV